MVEDLCRTPFYQIVNYKEYCDERICLCVCVFVFLSAIISPELRILSSPNVL